MQKTPVANRMHIAIFGKRNVGKSSLINALTQQPIAVVSDVAGTTTDPVYKTMEILPIGPVVIIDTAGIDDEGQLGELRIKKTQEVLKKADLAIIVIDIVQGITKHDWNFIERIRKSQVPIVGVINKIDLSEQEAGKMQNELNTIKDIEFVPLSAETGVGIDKLKQLLVKHSPKDTKTINILGDIISSGDIVVLVTPIDDAAPKGRLILPQQQVIRDILDHNAIAVVTKETELEMSLQKLGDSLSLVITDSQVFKKVDQIVPKDIPLTSFSILFSRLKGDIKKMYGNISVLKTLVPGDKVLIAEGCTHHRQCDDIGTVKIPNWLNEFVGGDLKYEWTSGTHFPQTLNQYKVIIHCGACMLNGREMKSRIREAEGKGIPIINYGMLIASLHGILDRAMEVFMLEV